MRIVRDRLERPAPPPGVLGGGARRSSTRCGATATRAVLRLTARFDQAELAPDQLQVDPRELEASLGVLEPEVLAGLRTAIANVRAVAEAQLRDPVEVELPEGQRVEVAEVPVRRVGVYVPGGQRRLPVDGGDVRGDRAGGGRRARSRSAPRRGPTDARTR